MKQSIRLFLVICCAVLVSSCASGPKFNEVKGSIPALSADHGRIYIYRTSIVASAVQPDVNFNGKVVGTAKPKGFFYVDSAPGPCQVETSTEVSRTLSLTLEKGQVRYVRLNVTMGFMMGHISPALIDNATAEKEIVKCSYTGTR